MTRSLHAAWLPLVCLAAWPAAGDAPPQPASGTDERLAEQIVVIGERSQVPGSGAVLDDVELDRFDQIDLNQVLAVVPGVYVREEDGYGLRPNIGIRGAAAERSQKVTIMQDGVPIAPAPYSAPAAYFVPNISRIERLEVLKGPAAIAHGPHTVGGAINLLSRGLPNERFAEADLSLAGNRYHKLAVTYGDALDAGDGGYLLEALRFGSDGFKELDGGGDTGFVRHDLGLKWGRSLPGSLAHRLTARIGYADEVSGETYLGLADADFLAAPKRRYAASRNDRFESEHWSAMSGYSFALGQFDFNAKAYWHRFDRSWDKLDGFIKGPPLPAVLLAPRAHVRHYFLLTGAVDAEASDADALEVTNNDRSFRTQGVQATLVRQGRAGMFESNSTVGVRLHQDSVRRNHQPRGYWMRTGRLVGDGVDRPPKVLNQAETLAASAFVSEELIWRKATITLGLRYENVDGEREDPAGGEPRRSRQNILSPGIGLYWQMTESLGLLAGVHRGVSPAGPGSGAANEESLNYEYGLRYAVGPFGVEWIGFFSDYRNLLGRCRVSDAGCQPGDEFNGGRVAIAGSELRATFTRNLGSLALLDVELGHTYTESAFQSSFLSSFPQWGLVRRGDELPYLPAHRGHLRVALAGGVWDVAATLRRQTAMREEPGRGRIEDGVYADGYAALDLAASWRLRDRTRVQVTVGNATNEAFVVSHRPFGARPNRPRWIALRVRQSF